MTCHVGYDGGRPEYVQTEKARCQSVSSGNPSKTKDIGPVVDIRQWLGRVTVTGGLEMLGTGAGDGGSGVVSTTGGGAGSAATTTAVGDGAVGTTTRGPAFPGTTVPTVLSSKTDTTAPTLSSSRMSTAGMAVVTGNLRVVAAVAAALGGMLVA